MDPVAEYLGTLQAERGVSRNTLAAYRRDLADFLAFLRTEHRTFATVVADDVVSYAERLTRRGFRPASISRRLSALRGFYRHPDRILSRRGI